MCSHRVPTDEPQGRPHPLTTPRPIESDRRKNCALGCGFLLLTNSPVYGKVNVSPPNLLPGATHDLPHLPLGDHEHRPDQPRVRGAWSGDLRLCVQLARDLQYQKLTLAVSVVSRT